jgi:peptidoglycan/xylan/chitin deacetylase (PgdA/CDA1 family)
MSVDDIHPGTSRDAYEAGGDLERGALGLLARLLAAHPKLRMTLFVTADWREISPSPTRWIRHLPSLRDRFFLAPVLPKGTMAVDRHPDFARYLKSVQGFELAHHGLHHVHRGLNIPVEFQNQSADEIFEILSEASQTFSRAGFIIQPGIQPPAWNTPPALLQAANKAGLRWINAARDIVTEPERGSKTNMSGPKGLSLLFPEVLDPGLLHFTSNFQATSPLDRAFKILDEGGLLTVKCHIAKRSAYHYALDGVDELYVNYLDSLVRHVQAKFGDSVWWTSFSEIEEYVSLKRRTS